MRTEIEARTDIAVLEALEEETGTQVKCFHEFAKEKDS